MTNNANVEEKKGRWWCLPTLIDSKVQLALENIVEHFWDDELADFRQHVESGSKAHHVFDDLILAHEWIIDQKYVRQFFVRYCLVGWFLLAVVFFLPEIMCFLGTLIN